MSRLILITIMFFVASCNLNTKEHIKPHNNTYCRVLVNTKSGYVSLVSFLPEKITEEKKESNIIKIDDSFFQLMLIPYNAHNGNYLLNQMWIKDIHKDKYLFLSAAIEELVWDDDWSKLCMSLQYHIGIDEAVWKFSRMQDRPYLNVNKNIIDQNSLSKNAFFRHENDEETRNRKICYCDELWCKYERNDRLGFSCELNKVRLDIENIELLDGLIIMTWSIHKQTCAKKTDDKVYISRLLSLDHDKNIVFSDISDFPNEPDYKAIKQSLGLSHVPFAPILFTDGTLHRRWVGHFQRLSDKGNYQRIELPYMTEGLEKILNGIENAPDGCGHFDWDTVELVNKSGQRYKIANGDYESIAGIYWLRPDEEFSMDMLDDKPETPIVLDEGYTPPPSQPNCRYFTEDARRERWEEKGRICYECESQYINPKGTGVTPEEACAEYDRDYDEVKDMIDI